MSTNIVYVECKQWNEAARDYIPAAYFANNLYDGYVYYNDYRFFRTWISNDSYKYQTEIYNVKNNTWVITNNIKEIKLYNFNAGAIINESHGGTPLPIGGQGVEDAVNYAIAIANDDNHGYNMNDRDGGVDFDCSSLVAWSFHYGGGFDIPCGGYDIGWSPNTPNMRTYYEAAGFEWIDWSDIGDSSNLVRGDILVNETQGPGGGHTAIYIGDGQIVEAAGDELGGYGTPQPGDQLQQWGQGYEIGISGFYYFPWGGWDGILRYTGGNSIVI